MNQTILFIIISFGVFVFLWIAFDVYIILRKGKSESISAHIIRSARKYPAVFVPLSMAIGFLGGHLFWSMDTFDWQDKENLKARCVKLLKE